MVGNDIVDLREAQKASNWERPRFLEKLFTEIEQHYIEESKNPFLMVWRLWSMKEASYKLYTQMYPSRFYNPKAFKCIIKNSFGIVKYKDFSCYVETKTTVNYIISEARLERQQLNSEIVKFTTNDYNKQREELKSKLLNTVGIRYQIEKSEFNIPTLSNRKEQFNISLTHHGNYGAYVIE